MPEPLKTYRTVVSGFWNPRHEIYEGDELVGTVAMKRNRLGSVTVCHYQPAKGSLLTLRREPGLLRGQFSLWAEETREWLAASVRFHFFRREFELSSGGKPYRLAPLPGFRRGWSLMSHKAGEAAQIRVPLVGRNATIEVYKRLDFILLLLAYTIGAQIYTESLLPGQVNESLAFSQKTAKASKA